MEEKSGWQKELNFDDKNVVKNFNQTSENIENGEYFLGKELPRKIFSQGKYFTSYQTSLLVAGGHWSSMMLIG